MNEINKIEVLKTKCSTKQENRVLSDRTKGQITCVCVCPVRAMSCSHWKGQSWTFLSHYISRFCMLLLSNFSFRDVTASADSETHPYTRQQKKTQQVTALRVKLSLYSNRGEHSPVRPE